MNKSQANLAVIARRAGARSSTPRVSTEPVSRNPALRAADQIGDTGVSPRKGKTRKAWAHKDITGRTSQWHSNPFYYSPIEIDRRWSA